jgi:hypothetical protein
MEEEAAAAAEEETKEGEEKYRDVGWGGAILLLFLETRGEKGGRGCDIFS